jgi:aspartyl-tRNA(Asn)/glutamyl-tRNA(Gln) amidotransferase subunit B
MELEPVIGLEIHVALKTKSKMFCSCANVSYENEEAFDGAQAKPNSSICPICMGYPGTLPVPNKTAIEWTQRAGAALNCELASRSKFDRKHYFYPDLPKGYQISQYDQPFCGEGVFEIIVDGIVTPVAIERIHLEEDAAKNLHPEGKNYTLIDFNRAGTPLIEIVTKPVLRSPAEARILLQEVQKIMRALDISDAEMEKGQMRCDANISLRERISPSARGGAGRGGRLHPKTEVKNINSFKFVAQALAYEIKRQTKLWEAGKKPEHLSTRGYDAERNVTTEQRTKEAAADYRYFPEPDIPPFEFTAEELGLIKKSLPELPLAKRTRFMNQLGLRAQQAQLFVEQPDLADFYENTVSELLQLNNEQEAIADADVSELKELAANVVLRQVRDLKGGQGGLTPANFAELIALVYQGKINKDGIAPVLEEMQKTGGDPDHIITNLGLAQMGAGDELSNIINEIIAANPAVVTKIKAGKRSAMQFLVGQVMQKTKGTANPSHVTDTLRQMLE